MLTAMSVVALLIAFGAYLQARRSARQVAQLTEMYWQLKYDHGELRAAVMPPSEPPPAASATAFVPLGSVKRNPS
jgi:hypothetical protein